MQYLIIDAFAARPFAGNPAAVVWEADAESLDDGARQAIAAEFNLAETAFVSVADDGEFFLRWFTPAREVPLCGHATLAAAGALWTWGMAEAGEAIVFNTRSSGPLICHRDGDMVTMDFPATPPEPCAAPREPARALGVTGPVECVGASPMNLLLRLPDEAQVRAASPDLPTVAGWHEVGVIITARAQRPEVDFVSRFFAPACGVFEDPVTGSAHCALGPYWARELGRMELVGHQLSARGGEVRVHVGTGDALGRVELAGRTVVMMEGTLLQPGVGTA